MEFLKEIFRIAGNLDQFSLFVQQHGIWVYVILFIIIFCETGLVVTPFLPGDSILFAAGAIGAKGSLSCWALIGLLSVAAIIGDAVNYAIGYYFGPKLLAKGGGRFIKKEYIEKTHRFYEKYGKKTIILARFVPIVRTFAPFLAGFGNMKYSEFFAYNVIGGIAWVGLCVGSGFFFGGLAFVQKHFEVVIIAIVVISILPIAIELLKGRAEVKAARAIKLQAEPDEVKEKAGL